MIQLRDLCPLEFAIESADCNPASNLYCLQQVIHHAGMMMSLPESAGHSLASPQAVADLANQEDTILLPLKPPLNMIWFRLCVHQNLGYGQWEHGRMPIAVSLLDLVGPVDKCNTFDALL